MAQWILTSSVLILLVLVVRGLFKNRMKAKAVYALWLLVLVRLLCPVNFGELSFNLLTLAEEGKVQVQEHLEIPVTEQQEARMVKKQDSAVFLEKVIQPGTVMGYESLETGNAEVSVPASEQVTEVHTVGQVVQEKGVSFPEISWQKVLLMAWQIGMAVMALVIAGVNISFSTTLGMFRRELPLLARQGRGKKGLSVYLADGISSSCLYGVVHPCIYLNKDGMSEQEKTYCVEHEYSHYLQGDMVWSVCRAVCLILHWYNPLVWMAVMLSKKDAELACDERTIERLGEEERYTYGHVLVELAAEQSRVVQMFGMATLMASDKKEVVERVRAIAIKKQTKWITAVLVTVLAVGMGFFVFTGEAKEEQNNNQNEVIKAVETPYPTEVVPAVETPYPTKIVPAIEIPGASHPTEAAPEPEESPVMTASGPTPMPTEFVSYDELMGDTSDVRSPEETVRIYKERGRTDNYIERTLTNFDIQAVRDAGDERWFIVVTADDNYGWVQYGESECVDSLILSLLGVSKETYAQNREEKARKAREAFDTTITYRPLVFEDHVTLEPLQGEGWRIDLNGDGAEEQLYIDKNSVFINGMMQLSYKEDVDCSFWLLDIDTTDGVYELYDNTGALYLYTGPYLREVKGICQQGFLVQRAEGGVIMSVYLGTLSEFARIDEHVISFEDCFFFGCNFFATAQYTLDANHNLQVVPQEEEVILETKTSDVSWYGEACKQFRVYQERNLNGEYVEVDSLEGALLTKSDCDEWVYIEIEDGLSGWLYFEEDMFFNIG